MRYKADGVDRKRRMTLLLSLVGMVMAVAGLSRGDCQEFRVWAMTKGRKDPSHGTSQTTGYP